MDNHRVLKAITSADLVNGGLLNPQQANQFIDYMIDQSAFLKEVRTIRMDRPTYNLDDIAVGTRVIRKGVEATAPTTTASITTGKKQLNTVEAILPADISDTFLEDNIERAQAEDHIAQLLAAQFANDLTDLAINGDTADVGPEKDFVSIDDGFVKLAKTSAATHKFDTNGSADWKGTVFPGMLQMLPNKWKNNPALLRFFVSPAVAQQYLEQLITRQTAWADQLLQTGQLPLFEGIKLFPVPYMPDDVVILTPAQNLAVGIQRDFRHEKMRQPRRRVVEHTMTMRFDAAQIIKDDAVVIAYDVA